MAETTQDQTSGIHVFRRVRTRLSLFLAKSWSEIRTEWDIWLPLLVIASFAFSLRFSAELVHPGPSGADYGNYLTNVAILWGHDVTGAGLQYPPLYLVYLTFLLFLFPPLVALQISGPLLAACLAFPAYKLVRLYTKERLAIFGAAIICLADPFSELMGWGGGPQILATIFLILFFGWGIQALEMKHRKEAILAGLALSGVAGSHQLSLLFVLLETALVGAGLLLVLGRKSGPTLRVGVETVGWGILFSLPYLPFYLIFSTRLAPFAPPNFITPDLTSFVTNAAFVLSYAALWLPLIVVAGMGYGKHLTRTPVRNTIGLVLLFGPFLLTLTVFAFHPARPIYEIPIGIAPGLAALLESVLQSDHGVLRSHKIRVQGTVLMVTLVIVGGVVYASQIRMTAAESYYYVLGPGVVNALSWLAGNTSTDSRVITNGPPQYGIDELNGYQWAWWIQGYAARMAYGTGSVPLQTYTDWAVQSDLANRYFAGRYLAQNAFWRIGENGPDAASGNPILLGSFAAGYKGAALFDDSSIQMNLSGNTASPFYWPNKSFSSNLADGIIDMTVRYSISGVVFERTSLLIDGAPNATVKMEITGPVSFVTIPLFTTSNAIVVNADEPKHRAEIDAKGDFGETNEIDVQIATRNATLIAMNPLGGLLPSYRVDFVFAISGPASSLSFDFHLPAPGARGPPGIRWTETVSLMEQVGVNYVFISKERLRDLQRFDSDSAYRTAFINGDIAIFQLINTTRPA